MSGGHGRGFFHGSRGVAWPSAHHLNTTITPLRAGRPEIGARRIVRSGG